MAGSIPVFNDPLERIDLPNPNKLVQRKRVNHYPGKISRIRNLTHDTLEVLVRYESDNAVLHAKAGQYATLTVNGVERPRAYSFAKAPELEQPGEATFFIRLVEGGELSNWFQEKERVGETVTLTGPLGHFGLDTSAKTIVCIAGGSGMSAIKALLEQAKEKQVARDCYFFYGARTQADLYCQEAMEAIKTQWPADHNFEFIPVLSEEEEASDWHGPRGLVTQYFKDQYLDLAKVDIENMKAYFCGPPPMIDHGVEVLKQAGLADENIYYDKFEDARSPAPVIDNTRCVLCDECLLVKPIESCIVETAGFKSNGDDPVREYQLVQPGQTSGLYYNALLIDSEQCIRCYACVDACPHDAIAPENKSVPVILRKR